MNKPIIHRRCGKRIPDAGEHIKAGVSQKLNDKVCTCRFKESSVFTSRPQPPDLQWYDKYNK